jgi:hypothetical protein
MLKPTGTTAGIIHTVTPTANPAQEQLYSLMLPLIQFNHCLSSVSGSDNPTNCVNTVLNISYAIGGGTNASITAGAHQLVGYLCSYNAGTRLLQSVEIPL